MLASGRLAYIADTGAPRWYQRYDNNFGRRRNDARRAGKGAPVADTQNNDPAAIHHQPEPIRLADHPGAQIPVIGNLPQGR